jgi:hypothetical protein
VQVVFGQSDSVAAKPSHVVGDTWIYRTVDWGKEKRRNKFVVLAVKGDVISLESTPVQIDGATNVGTPGKFNALLDKWDFFGSRIVSGSRSNIRFPLSVGDKWSYEYALANMTLQYEVSVDALEDVAVPAGTFRAFKIVHSGRYKMSDGSSTVRETFWYAPNVRNFVKWEHQSRAFNGSMYDNVQRELTEYKVN